MSSRSHSVQKGVVSPVFDASGDIVVASPQTSDIERVVTGGEGKDETEVLANLGGQPQAIAYDQDDLLYIADHAYAAVLVLRGDGTEQHVVKEYEGVALKGPSGLVFDGSGNLYFTDSGPLGETGLHSPKGSVFAITGSKGAQILRPLALECLAHPCGLAVTSDGSALFVCELLANRVIRLVQKPKGVFIPSTFIQFSGRMGPSAIAMDEAKKLLYIGRYDTVEGSKDGVVDVYDFSGKHVKSISIPGPEVTGVCLSSDGRTLVVTEGSRGEVIEFDV